MTAADNRSIPRGAGALLPAQVRSAHGPLGPRPRYKRPAGFDNPRAIRSASEQ